MIESPGLKWLSGVRDRHKEAILCLSWLEQSPSESWEVQRCKRMKKWSSWTKRTVPAVIIPTWQTEPNPDQQKLKTTEGGGYRFTEKIWKSAREKLNAFKREKDKAKVALSLSHPLGHTRRLAQTGQTGHQRALWDMVWPQSIWLCFQRYR